MNSVNVGMLISNQDKKRIVKYILIYKFKYLNLKLIINKYK